MTQEHPVTPPPELIQQWLGEFFGCTVSGELSDSERFLATRAAQWGADQELEACCEWFQSNGYHEFLPDKLRDARRPKPSSLKEQALEAVKQIPVEPDGGPWRTAMETIILALRQLPDND